MRFIRIPAALLAAFALAACSNLLFYPERQLIGTPDQVGLDYESAWFTSADGTRLHGWMVRADGPAKGTVLFLHGNAQNISYHLGAVHWLPAYGYNVFLFDYRGFGRSGGKADLDGIVQDAEAALAYVRSRPDVDPGRLVVFGQSIGAAITTWVMAHDSRDGVRAVVIEGAFSNYRRITREKLGGVWFLWPFQWPLSFLVSNRYSPERAVGHISPTPLLIVHGTADSVIPYHHAEILYRRAGEPKELWSVAGADHIAAFAPTRPEWRERLVEYLDCMLEDPPVRPAAPH